MTKRPLAETVNIAVGTHPILTAPTVTTIPAGHDLLGDGHVAQCQPIFLPCAGTHGRNLAHKFVAGNHRRLGVTCTMSISPEKGCAGKALEIAGADAHRVNPQQDFAGPRLGNRSFLQPVIFGSIADDRLH